MSWSRRFDEPIELPDGRKLRTLKEAIAWLAKEIPKSEHAMPKVQTAARMVTEAAENNGPMISRRWECYRRSTVTTCGSWIARARQPTRGNFAVLIRPAGDCGFRGAARDHSLRALAVSH